MQVIFAVTDVARASDFYDRAFRWQRNPLVEGFTNYVEYLLPDEQTVGAIEAAGGRTLSALADRAWGERAAWFADPDGNVVAVAQRVPTSDPAAQPF